MIPPMRDSLLAKNLGLQMKLLSQIQVGRAFLDNQNLLHFAQTAQGDEEQEETGQHQGEGEALSMVFQFPPHSQIRSELLES